MIRFNYLGADRPKPFAFIATTFAIDDRIRGPLAALIATLLLTAGISAVQFSRLTAARLAYARTSTQLARSGTSIAAVAALRGRIAAETLLAEHIGENRRASLLRINELAWIGNHLPHDTWLHAVRYEDGSYVLDGSSDRVAAVGSAMLALRENDRAAAPRLVSLRDDAGSGHVVYTLRLEATP